MSINKQLEKLYFRDSMLRGINVAFPGGCARTCTLCIDYYNREGNVRTPEENPDAPWRWRRMVLKFGCLAHIEFSAPDLVNRPQDLDELEINYKLDELERIYKEFKEKFPQGEYPLFESGEPVSIRLTTQNLSANGSGYLWLVGNEVSLEWNDSEALEGRIHY